MLCVASSRAMVRSEMKEMPMPAITACLMVSLLVISTLRCGTTPCSERKRSIAARVPEPGSRSRKISFASRCGSMRFSRASG